MTASRANEGRPEPARRFPISLCVLVATVAALWCLPRALPAQGFLEQFSYEGLRLTGIGFEVGGIASNRLTSEVTPAVRVDFGMLAPRVRLLVGASYFHGFFKPREITRFAQTLRSVVTDPTNDFTINVGTISWSDFEGDIDLQYLFPARAVRAYFGLGMGVHARNGTGAAIDGTFVEDALDTIGAGLNASAGLEVAVASSLAITVDVRGTLASELRTASLRGGLMYRLPRKAAP